ncbi:MAG: hypothetical protein LBP29_07800, partial [Treponema sp.]|nr:hypothetical protein [Treponema sp.]
AISAASPVSIFKTMPFKSSQQPAARNLPHIQSLPGISRLIHLSNDGYCHAEPARPASLQGSRDWDWQTSGRFWETENVI